MILWATRLKGCTAHPTLFSWACDDGKILVEKACCIYILSTGCYLLCACAPLTKWEPVFNVMIAPSLHDAGCIGVRPVSRWVKPDMIHTETLQHIRDQEFDDLHRRPPFIHIINLPHLNFENTNLILNFQSRHKHLFLRLILESKHLHEAIDAKHNIHLIIKEFKRLHIHQQSVKLISLEAFHANEAFFIDEFVDVHLAFVVGSSELTGAYDYNLLLLNVEDLLRDGGH